MTGLIDIHSHYLASSLVDALARESEGAIHLIVKWAARYGPDTVEKHVEVANAMGSVWW